MTRTGRALCTIYTLAALWFVYCIVQTWADIPLWVSITLAAAGVALIVVGRRESEHADELRALRVELERAARSTDTTPVITEQERTTFEQLVTGLDLDDAA